MKFSESWLRSWVNPDASTEELGHQLTMAGLEVDAIDKVAAQFTGVVIGKVLGIDAHPDADKLRVCSVDVGADIPLQIVCGAANVHVGMLAPTAIIGAVLPGNFKIKKSKLRGVPSFGMLCSASELGLAESSEGLMPLPSDSPVGTDLREYLDLDDHAIELSLTPNRGDCLSLQGIARETGVIYQLPFTGPSLNEVSSSSDQVTTVDVKAAEACPRYLGRQIRGLNPESKTPLWMEERLRRSGLRSLGPLIDVTNYVLLELGQPMHAFDLGKLQQGIQVRMARCGESLLLLNDQEIDLRDDSLLICDGDKPIALAGIMGGSKTAVEQGNTTAIMLESAFFSPDAISGRARAYGLHTDSSHRFERGVDPYLQGRAMERATSLLVEICGGDAGPVVEVVNSEHLPQNPSIHLRLKRIESILGIELSRDRLLDILQRLGQEVEELDGSDFKVTAPSFRFDLQLEIDLIEEVGRIVGYDNIPLRRISGAGVMVPRSEGRLGKSALKQILVERDYQEAICYSFVDQEILELLKPEIKPITLANPISSDMAQMRTTLWGGLLMALRHNINRQQERVRLFESGLTFIPTDSGELLQQPMLAGAIYGNRYPEQWGISSTDVDFFDLKGDVEALMAAAGSIEVYKFLSPGADCLHPGQSAEIRKGEETIGQIGLLHPKVSEKLGLPGKIFLFELLQEPLLERAIAGFNPLSKFPAIRRDLAFLVNADTPAVRITDAVRQRAPSSLRYLKLFDLYQGEHIENSRKSIALGLTLQEETRTLKDGEVDAIVDDIVAFMASEFNATLRD